MDQVERRSEDLGDAYTRFEERMTTTTTTEKIVNKLFFKITSLLILQLRDHTSQLTECLLLLPQYGYLDLLFSVLCFI
jgi:hypothetical protein